MLGGCHPGLENTALNTDDTNSSCQDTVEQVVIKHLEEDAKSILEFIASDGLVANPSKAVMLNSNIEENDLPKNIKVGEHEIMESKSAKLLEVVMGNDHKWKSHLCCKGGLM